MTALSAARNTAQMSDKAVLDLLSLKMAPVKIYQGSLVMIDAGYAKPGATATGKIAAGRAAETVDNSAGNPGDLSVTVRQGVFKFGNSTSGDLIAQANVGATCYIVDDQTVALTNGSSTRSAAGTVVQVDSDGVWVSIRAF